MELRLCSRLLISGSRFLRPAAAISTQRCRQLSSGSSEPAAAAVDEHYDVVVAGGGMVGFALACALGQSSRLSELRILLLESSKQKPALPGFPTSWQSTPYSNRVSAIANHSVALLDRLGAWQDITAVRVGRVKKMQVWESESDAHISFGSGGSSDDGKCVAHIVENDVLLEALRRRLPPTVQVRYGSRAESYSLPSSAEQDAVLHLQDGSVISTSLLVGCDGAESLVRRTMGGRFVSWDYKRMGVVATLELEQSEDEENNTAWQKFLPGGPIAILPLCRGQSSLVWSTTPSHAKALLAMDPQQFTDAINNTLWCDDSSKQSPWLRDLHQNCSDAVRQVGNFVSKVAAAAPVGVSYKQLPPSVVAVADNSRAAFPLGLGHAVQYTAPRVVLVGDAAHRVHPLAGQGVNLGFGDVAALTRVLEETVLEGDDIGNVRQLYRYETERQRQNVVMMAAVDGLHRLYATTFPPAVFLRSVGLTAVDAFKPIKNCIQSYVEG
uniref:Ubiquinone biosynthesis monooxygenase COQ6, mitochondrial n=1 Tax=Hirondellea gigas TaxID=1518452 RepID=A0A2P2HZT8_9CRUS